MEQTLGTPGRHGQLLNWQFGAEFEPFWAVLTDSGVQLGAGVRQLSHSLATSSDGARRRARSALQ